MTPEEAYERFHSCYVFVAEGLGEGYELTDAVFDALSKQIPTEPVKKKETFSLHDWETNKEGKIDFFAAESDYHNGPVCNRCGKTFCIHCTPNYTKIMLEECVHEYFTCPSCGKEVKFDEHHCSCGQTLNWVQERG